MKATHEEVAYAYNWAEDVAGYYKGGLKGTVARTLLEMRRRLDYAERTIRKQRRLLDSTKQKD